MTILSVCLSNQIGGRVTWDIVNLNCKKDVIKLHLIRMSKVLRNLCKLSSSLFDTLVFSEKIIIEPFTKINRL